MMVVFIINLMVYGFAIQIFYFRHGHRSVNKFQKFQVFRTKKGCLTQKGINQSFKEGIKFKQLLNGQYYKDNDIQFISSPKNRSKMTATLFYQGFHQKHFLNNTQQKIINSDNIFDPNKHIQNIKVINQSQDYLFHGYNKCGCRADQVGFNQRFINQDLEIRKSLFGKFKDWPIKNYQPINILKIFDIHYCLTSHQIRNPIITDQQRQYLYKIKKEFVFNYKFGLQQCRDKQNNQLFALISKILVSNQPSKIYFIFGHDSNMYSMLLSILSKQQFNKVIQQIEWIPFMSNIRISMNTDIQLSINGIQITKYKTQQFLRLLKYTDQNC